MSQGQTNQGQTNQGQANQGRSMLVKKVKDNYLVVLPIEAPVAATLTQIVKKQAIAGGLVSGIGAVKNVQLGYYDLEKKDYVRKTFAEEDYELISMNGNISLRDGEPYVHLHASMGRSDFSVFGGHLFEAVVAVTVEIQITILGALPERQMQEDLGLQTITRCPI